MSDNQLTKYESAFSSVEKFEQVQRMAKVFAESNFIPKDFKGKIGDCMIALDMASQMGMNPLSVMQNMAVIQGRPSFSSTFQIALINSCGKFEPLRFELKKLDKKTVEYSFTVYENGVKEFKKGTETIQDQSCVCYSRDITGKELRSIEITIEMAVKEGWFSKPGSKWKTFPEQMLQYRAASFWKSLYAPEITMGIKSTEEIADIVEVQDGKGNVISADHKPESTEAPKARVRG